MATTPTITLTRAQRDHLCQSVWSGIDDGQFIQRGDDEFRAYMGATALFRALAWTPEDDAQAKRFEMLLTDEIMWLHENILRREREDFKEFYMEDDDRPLAEFARPGATLEERVASREFWRTHNTRFGGFISAVDAIDAALGAGSVA